MKIKVVEAKDSIKLLTDPQPSFMALVDHGANQTPFSTVKHVSKPKRQEIGMKGKGSKAPDTRLTKMQFSKAKFPTAKAVSDWLDKNDIEGADEPVLEDDVWVVNSAEDFSDVKLGKARSTATKHEGVTAFIAPVEEDGGDEGEGDDPQAVVEGAGPGDDDDEGEEGDDPAATTGKGASKARLVDGEKTGKTAIRKPPVASQKTDEPTEIEPVLALKFDWWGAYSSDDESLMGVLKDGMEYDNVPPGMDDVMMAMFITMGNVLSDDQLDSAAKLNALKQAGDELATLTVGLFDLFQQATEDATKSLKPDVRKLAKKFADAYAESVARMTEGKLSVDNVVNDEGEGEGAAAPKEIDTDAIAAAAAKAVAKELGGRLDNVEKSLARAPARKSMSESLEELGIDDNAQDEQDKEQSLIVRNQIRRNMGLPALPA